MEQKTWNADDFYAAQRFWLDVFSKEDTSVIDDAFKQIQSNDSIHQDLYVEMAFFTSLLLRKKSVYQYVREKKPDFQVTLMVFQQLSLAPEVDDYLLDTAELTKEEALGWAIRDSKPNPMSSFEAYCTIKKYPELVGVINELIQENRLTLEDKHLEEMFSFVYLDYMGSHADDFFVFANTYVEHQLRLNESREQGLLKLMEKFFLGLERHYRYKPESYLNHEHKVSWVNWCFNRLSQEFTPHQIYTAPIGGEKSSIKALELAASIKDPFLFSRIALHIIDENIDYFGNYYKYKNQRCCSPLEMLCIVVSEMNSIGEREPWLENATELTHRMLQKGNFSLDNINKENFIVKKILMPVITHAKEQFEFSQKLKNDIIPVKNKTSALGNPQGPSRF